MNLEPRPGNGLVFEENAGQVMDQDHHERNDILFSGNTEGLDFHIRKDGISYQLTKKYSRKNVSELAAAPEEEIGLKRRHPEPDSISIYRVDVTWLEPNDTPIVEKGTVLPGYSNYYKVAVGRDPAVRVHQYGSVKFRDIWKGVDVDFHAKNGVLECDWYMADPDNHSKIRFRVDGAELKVALDGSLVMATPFGEIREGRILADQRGRSVDARWVITGNVVSVDIRDYKPGAPLLIDPPIRLWGTYVGGTGEEEAFHMEMDGSGGVYVAGGSYSSNMATTGAHQMYGSNQGVAYLARFNAAGVRMWATYYGGFSWTFGYGCARAPNGDVLMSGVTRSTTMIGTPGTYQEVISSPASDAFLVRFTSEGERIWGTYFGGPNSDEGWSCATDGAGNAYLAGATRSRVNIATSDAHQPTPGHPTQGQDAFLAKFDPNGARLWSTFFGGPGEEEGYSCATDPAGNVYLSGMTTADTMISTPGAYQEVKQGYSDVYLAKFNPSGVRLWGTYFGGEGLEGEGYSTVDSLGQIFLAGWTLSDSAIATPGSHQQARAGNADAFIAKFNSAGQRQWSTYYGGPGDDEALSCKTDGTGSVLVTGNTKSSSGIASPGTYDGTLGGNQDGFLARFNSQGIRHWATYYGGTGVEHARGCTGDGGSVAYMCGFTDSSYGIASSGAFTTSYVGGLWDMFLVKMDGCDPYSISASATATSICEHDSVDLTASGALSYSWSASPSLSALTGSTVTAYPASSTTYSVTGSDQWGCKASASVTIIVLSIDSTVTVDGPTLVAMQNNAQYQWLECSDGLTALSGETGQSFTPSQNGSFAVEITRGGCVDTTSCQTVLSVGMVPLKAGLFHVYPNPARGQASYSFDAPGVHLLRILDARGAIVHSERIQAARQGQIDLRGLAPGIYTVELKGDQVWRERLCVCPE